MPRAEMTPGTYGDFGYRHLDDGRIQVSVRYRRVDGHRDRTTTIAASKAAGERKLKDRLKTLIIAVEPDATGPTLDEVVRTWAGTVQKHSKNRASTKHEQSRLLKSLILPTLGPLPVEEITPSVVMDWYYELVERFPPQARNAKGVLSKILGHAANLELIDRNPLRDLTAVPREAKEIFAPDIAELEALRQAVIAYEERPGRMGPKPSPLLRDVIEMILGTSGRISEVLGLRLHEDIFFGGEIPAIEFNGAVKEGDGQPKRWEPLTKTESGHRRVPIDDTVVAIILRRMVERRGNSPYLFCTASGAPNGPQDVHRALRNVRAWAGLDPNYVPHAFRRTVATEIANDAGIEAAAQTLGHKRSRVTEKHYAKKIAVAPDMRHVLGRLHGGHIG